MESWLAPAVPPLPGVAPPLRLFDHARDGVYPMRPLSGARTMYVCGITPYDATHIGHAATMISFDLVHRLWLDQGCPVNYVQNVTDVDDPLLERAQRDQTDWMVLAMSETALFREDMHALGVLPPQHYVGAVESISAIALRVSGLLAAGQAYRLTDGDIYFDLAATPRFGYESRLDRATMLALSAQRGGDPDRPGKRDPLDPLLWRAARAGEPSWEAGVLGAGRPGWHIECAVIALDYLGGVIDVQGGGNDLIFPHHECSAAHAEVLTGSSPFASHYTHAGMIGLDGEKMSKSRGNLVFVSRLRGDGVDPMAIRLALLADHYRTDRAWTGQLLSEAEVRLSQWRRGVACAHGPDGRRLLTEVREALADDLNAPAALAKVDSWAQAAVAGAGSDATAPDLVRASVDALLGIGL